MKRIIALLLTACMFLGSAAIAEEALTEKLFWNGLVELLNSVDLQRDMLTLRVDYLNDTVFDAALRQQDGMVDASVHVADTALQAQISDTDITAAMNGTAVNLQFADVEAFLNTIKETLSAHSGDVELLQELAQLFWETVVLPDLKIEQADALHISYSATATGLLERLSAFGDAVLAEEKYDGLLEQLLGCVALVSGETMPSFAELKAMWPAAKEELTAVETDFEAAFDLTAGGSGISLSAHLGNSRRMYETAWGLSRSGNEFHLDGHLTETRQTGERTFTSENTVTGSLIGDGNANVWSLDIQAPIAGFTLTADGSVTGKSGTVHIVENSIYNRRYSLTAFINYAYNNDGLTAMAYVAPGRGTPFIADLLLNERECAVSVNNYSGQKLFRLSLLADDQHQLYRAYLEYNQPPRNTYTMLYDGEKLIITRNDLKVTCTGALESDHAYVITLHAEGDNVSDDESNAFIRFEYAGEEGRFTVTGKVIGPDGTEGILAELSCKPTEPIESLLRDQEGTIRLTPDFLQTLLLPQ